MQQHPLPTPERPLRALRNQRYLSPAPPSATSEILREWDQRMQLAWKMIQAAIWTPQRVESETAPRYRTQQQQKFSSVMNNTTATLRILAVLLLSFCINIRAAEASTPISVSDINAIESSACLSAISFDLCVPDTYCKGRFYLDHFVVMPLQKQVFDYLLEQYLLGQPSLPSNDWFLALLASTNLGYTADFDSAFLADIDLAYGTACATNGSIGTLLQDGTNLSVEDGRAMWLLFLRQASFCTENEVYVLDVGCVCREGKTCDEISAGMHLSSTGPIMLFIAVVAVVALWAMFRNERLMKGLRHNQDVVIETAKESALRIEEALRATLPHSSGAAVSASTATRPEGTQSPQHSISQRMRPAVRS